MAKHVIEGKVWTRDHKIFHVLRAGGSEQEIVVHFGHRVKYRVVKLTTKDLPPRDKDGKKIKWVNNYGVIDASGNYVRSVLYTVFLLRPLRKSAHFVYWERGRLKRDKEPRRTGSKPPRDGMLQVDFSSGDPGPGWK